MPKLLVPPYIMDLPSYPLGKDYREDEIRLSANENPLGPSPLALKRIEETLCKVHRYPDGLRNKLLKALAEWLKVEERNLVLGNGSNEIVDMVIKAFLREGDEVLVPSPGYAYYRISARARGGIVKEVPLDFPKINLFRVASLINEKTKIIFLDNPNNPTGTIFTQREFLDFLKNIREEVVIVLDCAYAEFVEEVDYLNPRKLLEIDRSLIILRTFSKFFGLAGLRIGYGIARKELVEVLERVRQPFNVSLLSLAGALGALEDLDFQKRTRELVLEGRRFLEEGLKELGLEYVPSQANFLLVRVGEKKGDLLKILEEDRIVVRDMSGYGLPEYIRVTIGKPEENRRLLDSFKRWAIS
jgi:histidinol-phosphate aminotransferase